MRTQTTEGGAIPSQAILHYVRKLVEHELTSQSISSIPPWFLLQFLLESLP